MKINGEYETDYWHHVILEFRSKNGHVGSTNIHSQARELEFLRDNILEELDEYELSEDRLHHGFDPDDLEGLPDERMIARDYSYNLVALFSISCGIMEKQLEILLSQYLISDNKREGVTASCFVGRGLYDNLEFAKAAQVIGNKKESYSKEQGVKGVYSEAHDVRQTRNRLVHNPTFRLSIQSYNIHRQRIKKAVRAPNKLDKLIQQVTS